MTSPVRIAGLASTDVLWFALAAETATDTHYAADRIPPIIRTKLEDLRKAAEQFASAADYIGALLAAEGVDGVDVRTTEVSFGFAHDDEEDEEWRG